MKKQLEDFGGKVFNLDLKCDNEEEKKNWQRWSFSF
jgi:hypothetical protein